MIDATNTSSTVRARPIAKWGAAATPGWQPLPDVLLKHQAELELSATDMLVLINVLSYWWYVEQKPFPRLTTIAKRMGVTVRSVQRSIQKLVELGYLRRQKTRAPNGEERETFDPEGLVNVLQEFATKGPAYDHTQQMMERVRGLEASFS